VIDHRSLWRVYYDPEGVADVELSFYRQYHRPQQETQLNLAWIYENAVIQLELCTNGIHCIYWRCQCTVL